MKWEDQQPANYDVETLEKEYRAILYSDKGIQLLTKRKEDGMKFEVGHKDEDTVVMWLEPIGTAGVRICARKKMANGAATIAIITKEGIRLVGSHVGLGIAQNGLCGPIKLIT